MKLSIETNQTVVTIDNKTKGDIDESDVHEALEMWMGAMVGLTYQQDSINRAIMEKADEVGEVMDFEDFEDMITG